MIRALVIAAVLSWMPAFAQAQVQLYMAEEVGCFWCARWNKEISEIYPKTSEGRAAPLVRYDLHNDKPDIVLKRRVNFTPTFLLVKDGQEVSRIEGYPGEDFFWGLLGEMLKQAGVDLSEESVQ